MGEEDMGERVKRGGGGKKIWERGLRGEEGGKKIWERGEEVRIEEGDKREGGVVEERKRGGERGGGERRVERRGE